MTLDEIKAAGDMAEKWPGATVLDFGELPFRALAAWVALHPCRTHSATESFDVESVKGLFEDWWRAASRDGKFENGFEQETRKSQPDDLPLRTGAIGADERQTCKGQLPLRFLFLLRVWVRRQCARRWAAGKGAR